jgi:hypothetical protein
MPTALGVIHTHNHFFQKGSQELLAIAMAFTDFLARTPVVWTALFGSKCRMNVHPK